MKNSNPLNSASSANTFLAPVRVSSYQCPLQGVKKHPDRFMERVCQCFDKGAKTYS